jgi:hypothetical protein
MLAKHTSEVVKVNVGLCQEKKNMSSVDEFSTRLYMTGSRRGASRRYDNEMHVCREGMYLKLGPSRYLVDAVKIPLLASVSAKASTAGLCCQL